jgi:hypothetical protein
MCGTGRPALLGEADRDCHATQIRQLRAGLGPSAIAKRLGIARSSVYRLLA